MKFQLIKIYFKGGILVPFYTCLFFALVFAFSSRFADVLELALFSGLTGLCSLTMFVNSNRKIAENFFYSLLSWILLPYCFITYVLATKPDWSVFSDPKHGDVFITSFYFAIFFLHIIGLIISFQSFRATVISNKNEKEIMNDVRDDSAMLHRDRNVQVSDTTEAK